ncbi:hypothetical protein [Falsiroseomonas tokyonensis]|uniref:Uncharacterized protein n=1 Tax=Falsiroseomonas tokyonensis TaxID=430521 RepID=A0ABV7BP29_9PROT|nr:hypothetical protein [Falsiroseomonas tokyonensis]MBU8536584.1 hypothetical protein [Falsiroseomonas tokyonensis]
MAQPVVLLQGAFGILILALIAVAIITGDFALGPVGLWSVLVVPAFPGSVVLLARYEAQPPRWTARRFPDRERRRARMRRTRMAVPPGAWRFASARPPPTCCWPAGR